MTLIISLVSPKDALDVPRDAVAVSGVSTDAFPEHPLHGFLSGAGFEAKAGTTDAVPDGDRAGLVVGLGPDADRDADAFRTIGGAIARAGAKHAKVVLDAGILEAAGEVSATVAAQALAEGIGLGHYRYTALKSEPEPPELTEVHVVAKGGKRVQAALELGFAIADAVSVARDLVNEPGGTLTPPAYAAEIQALGETYGFEVSVMDEVAIEAAEMGGLLGVNRGSDLPPRFVELKWVPDGNSKGAVALCGKGVTFDSGGLSLKPSDSMLGMKGDMGGSAAVVGTFCALAAVSPNVEVRGYVPLTDNMTGGDATRLGDVLRISNGKTVEIHNTDAEGRLILADALSRASAEEPDAVIDLATLTGACMVALGATHAGVFGNNQELIDQVLAAGAAVGEKSWHLPLPDEWRELLDSDIADMRNIGGRYGGASTAGLFLAEFVGEGIPWVHVDIAGPAFVDKESPTETKGGTGYGVRTMLAMLKAFKKPAAD